MEVTLKQLRQVHPLRAKCAVVWADYKLLYQGGFEFKRAAGMAANNPMNSDGGGFDLLTAPFAGQRSRRFLFQFEGEPDPVFETYWQRSEYVNICAAIVDYYCQYLFTEPPQIRPREGQTAPDWYETFSENASGGGQSFVDFVKGVFQKTLICQRAGWLIGRDDSVGAVADGDDRVVLTPFDADEIVNWQEDTTGELLWILLHKKTQFQDFPDERREEETFTYVNRDMWKTWEVVKDGKTESLEVVGAAEHGLGQVPFVPLVVPNGMWILDKIAQPCLGLYNRWNRLKNAEAMGCIMQPWFKSTDGNYSRIFGETAMINLRQGDGQREAEDFGWKSPDTGPIEFISAQIDKARDEIYRIVHQMSLAVDSKAVGAIARSGASKIEDRRSSQILLAAYGSYVAPAMLKTVQLLSRVYRDPTVWSIDGFKNFDISSLDEELTTAGLAMTMNFKSATARKRIELRTIDRLLDGEDESTLQVIEDETDAAYEQEAMGVMPGDVVGDVTDEQGITPVGSEDDGDDGDVIDIDQ